MALGSANTEDNRSNKFTVVDIILCRIDIFFRYRFSCRYNYFSTEMPLTKWQISIQISDGSCEVLSFRYKKDSNGSGGRWCPK